MAIRDISINQLTVISSWKLLDSPSIPFKPYIILENLEFANFGNI